MGSAHRLRFEGLPALKTSTPNSDRLRQHEVGGSNPSSRLDDLVDQALLKRFPGGHEVVPVDVVLDLFDTTSAVKGDDLRHASRRRENLTKLDLHVAGRPPGSGAALMDHDLGVR